MDSYHNIGTYIVDEIRSNKRGLLKKGIFLRLTVCATEANSVIWGLKEEEMILYGYYGYSV